MATDTAAALAGAVQAVPQPAAPSPASARAPHRSGALLPGHLPALDGIRGLAVAVVVLFHLGHLGAPGGWLGVDVFFSLSGFLITALLLAEHERSGRISLRRFWERRVRRLAPALVLALLVIMGIALLRDPGAQQHAVGRDTLWTLGYVVNWTQAIPARSAAVAHELRHLWSLGVEEQIYLVWPPLLAGLLAGARNARHVGWFAASGAAASALLMLVLADRGIPLDRLYYGSDTHLQPVLAGAALAACLHATAPEHRARWAGACQAGGWLGLAALAWATLRLSSLDPAIYRGGFLAIAVAVAAILAAVTLQPRGRLARVLSIRPLVWLGRRSYGIYLWHWPIICWLTEADTGLPAGQLAALRIATTAGVAALSHRLVETPIRVRSVRALGLPTQVAGVAATIAVVAGGASLMVAY